MDLAGEGDDLVEIEISQNIATLRLVNPPLNLITLQLTRALSSALNAIVDDSGVRVVILTGHGSRAFSAGSDIGEFSRMLAPGEVVRDKLAPQNDVFGRIARLSLPTIAALNGDALGGGLELAVCCDMIVAEEQVVIGSPEIKLGVLPSSGGTFRVARRIGQARAKEMQLLGNAIDAITALSWGLVNRLAPAGESLVVANELATILRKRPPRALALCKSIIDKSLDLSEAELIELSLRASDEAFASDECREGVKAFLNRRLPEFGAHCQKD
jgi:enoyl-CoA hydratase